MFASQVRRLLEQDRWRESIQLRLHDLLEQF
jgi:hypothetical protein